MAGTFRKGSSVPMKRNLAPITPAGAGYVRADTRLKEESRTGFMDGWPDTPTSSWWPNSGNVEPISCMGKTLIV
ncbi:hypothetical protein DXD04_06555 [Phocaeicola plebeius]|uniref:Uncharacterized protein n=2 Tax=Phocaeicola plebeius TaxID=310297 RepID=A0A3E4N459_9BACT|nr:hypothetical protein DXD04_06555 [Phocaeicola plebeius]